MEQVDHETQALARVAAYLRNKPRFEGFLRAVAAEINVLEAAILDVRTLGALAVATGATLDAIGAIVGQPRPSADDEVYRTYIRARIALNRSSGTGDELLAIFALISAAPASLVEYFPAALELRLDGATSATLAPIFASFLKRAKAGGVRALLIWHEAAEGTADGSALRLGKSPGLGITTDATKGGRLSGIA